MSHLPGFLTRDIPLRLVALLIAVFFWVVAVLDRTYDVRVVVPVIAAKSETKRVIPDLDTRNAAVTLEGKGRDLLGVKLHQLAFRLDIPDGKVGSRQLQLSPAALKLPPDVRVRAIDPEKVELKLTVAASRSVAVQVPTRGRPPSGISLAVNQPPAQVKLLGPEEDVKLAAAVVTETLDLATVTEPGTRRLRVIPPEGGRYTTEPESVDIVVALEKEGARIFLGVPVKVVAANARGVVIDPVEAQVAVAGPASRIGSLRAEDIVAQVKISGLGPGEYQLAAELSLPAGFHLVKCEPQLFDVTVK